MHHLLHAGYVRDDGVASSVSLVLDGDVVIVVDPGTVADCALILGPLGAQGLSAGDVTHVVITHHHPDHTVNLGLFRNAEVVDFWARYRDDQWLDHEGDGYRVSEHARLILTPGHTNEVDPLADDQAALEVSRRRILAEADIVVPGHGEPFKTQRLSG